jgi:hypothetical protein
MGCTKLLQKGVPLPDIMHLVGWKDFDSVRRYMGLLTHSRIGGGRRGGLGLNLRLMLVILPLTTSFSSERASKGV